MAIKQAKLFRGQSTIEYTLMIVAIIGALLAMQVYFKRGVQGRLRDNVENIGKQYDPASANITSNLSVSSSSTANTVSIEEGGKLKTTTTTNSTTNSTVSSNESVGAL